MTDLLDIAPVAEKVAIGDKEIECEGISLEGVANIVRRFPAIRGVIWNGVENKTLDVEGLIQALLTEAPDAIAAILAAGTGKLGSELHERAAARLPIESQLDLLSPILKGTMPNGIGPFVEKLMALFRAVGGDDVKRLQLNGFDGENQPLPNGKASDTSSLSASSG